MAMKALIFNGLLVFYWSLPISPPLLNTTKPLKLLNISGAFFVSFGLRGKGLAHPVSALGDGPINRMLEKDWGQTTIVNSYVISLPLIVSPFSTDPLVIDPGKPEGLQPHE